MENSIWNVLKVPETREKIIRTLGLLVCYRIGFWIPIPGTSPQFLDSALDTGSVFGLMSAFSGGALGRTTIFALGIMPFISASIIFSMLAKISPQIEAVAKEGAAGQKKITQWTRLATVPIAILQGLLIYTGFFLREPQMIAESMRGHTFFMGMIVILALLAGSLLVMWIGELITEYGVGNGASLIIMAGIIAEMPGAVKILAGTDGFYEIMLQMAAIWAVTVFVVVFIHKGARRIPIQYARLTRGRRVYGGQRHYLPLKVNMAGVMPIIFASVIFVVPGVIFDWLKLDTLGDIFRNPTGFVYVSLYIALLFFFCFFWNRLMFNPEEIADNLREHGSFIPGIRPGARTAEYLSSTLTRITLAGSAFLAVIAVLPAFITSGTAMPTSMVMFLGGTSILIVVSVALDMVDKISAQAVMKNYDSYVTDDGPGWAQGGEGSGGGKGKGKGKAKGKAQPGGAK